VKKFIILILVALLIFLSFVITRFKKPDIAIITDQISTPTIATEVEMTQTPSLKLTPSVSTRGGTKIAWIIVRDLKKIVLIPNFEEKATSNEAKNANSCINIISGGFYKEGDVPIGLFISESKLLNAAEENDTFNGFFSITMDDVSDISYTSPTSAKIALQSGPIVYFNSKPVNLSLVRDEPARRIILALNHVGQVIFVVFYERNSTTLGPKLSEVPKMLEDLDKSTNLDFEKAINLDGGTHSAFISDTENLTEISSSGSFFCIKP